jgi:hypothetical protein
MRALLIVTLVVSAPLQDVRPPAAGRPPSLDSALNQLRQSVSLVTDRRYRQRLDDAAAWLERRRTAPDTAVSDEYVRSLQRIAELLASRRFELTAAVLDDVTQELEAKVDHCRTLGIGMGGSVRLTVNTRRGSAVVPNWQVFYLLKFDEWLKTPPRTFPRVSSPTDFDVDPGRYWIWARNPATGTNSERVLVEVGKKTDIAVDLPVP